MGGELGHCGGGLRALWAAILLWSLGAMAAQAAEGEVTFSAGGESLTRTAAELLARPDVERITIPADVAYGRPMQYEAIPLSTLLAEAHISTDDPVEAKAADGFVAQFPPGVFADRGPNAARAYLAIEPTQAPWPKLKGKSVSAGPFYIVWLRPQASHIGSEQWAYQVVGFESALDPLVRWPQLNVPEGLPADDPARAGLAVFLKTCMPCHRMNGGGEAQVGPDLNLPMNPTEYFQPAALRKYIRDPASVRTWPDRQMMGFPTDFLSDTELDQLLAYLAVMPGRRH